MDISVWRRETVSVSAVRLRVPIRYADDLAELKAAGWPGLSSPMLELTIGIDDGRVEGWDGVARSLHTKVVDTGYYVLLSDSRVVAEGDGYVPGFMPGEHYGDYLILDVDENGRVSGWRATRQSVEESWLLNEEE